MINQINFLSSDMPKLENGDITKLIQSLRIRIEELQDLINELKLENNVEQLLQTNKVIESLEMKNMALK